MSNYWKHPKFGHVYGDPIVTPRGRLCWVHLVTPKAFTGASKDPNAQPSQPRFEVSLLLAKDNEKTEAFLSEIRVMVGDMLDVYNKGRKVKLDIDLDNLLLDGEGEKGNLEKYPFYKGQLVLAGRNQERPEIKDAKKNDIDVVENQKAVMGGMVGRLIVTPMITTHGVSFKVQTVQVISDDGTRFGGGARDHSSLLDNLGGDEEETGEEETVEEESGVQASSSEELEDGDGEEAPQAPSKNAQPSVQKAAPAVKVTSAQLRENIAKNTKKEPVAQAVAAPKGKRSAVDLL